MGIEIAKTGKLLYHLTELNNLDSIIKYGMLPRKTIIERKIRFDDVANAEIITKRQELGLDKYTPFHFHPYSAFDVVVKNTHRGQDMIYLCINRKTARKNEFRILPKHPLTLQECKIYDYDNGFNLIDWDTMIEINREDDYAKHVKMAECLTEKRIAIDAFTCMFVASEQVKEKVIRILNDNSIDFPPPYINVSDIWFVK
ncbi:MAG: DarT ssDNA thymidine ADP-ribosyltransferase family protein [Acetivibrio sp.]